MSNAIFKRSNIENWIPTKYFATCCSTIICSNYPGELKSCKCEKSFVDETNYYARLGGTVELYSKEEHVEKP